jgi:hypothetical protein
MAPKSNVELLTEGASYIQRAKRARKDQIAEVKFDDDARREWLTGFSKRKKAKTDERRARAKERERKEHLEERAKVSADGAICEVWRGAVLPSVRREALRSAAGRARMASSDRARFAS